MELDQDPFARFGDGHLIKLVLGAVEAVDALVPVSNRPDFNPAQILTLLTYCYARGIYGSEEIEMRLPTDPAIAYICAGEKPDWHLLRQFRRQNVFLLSETLVQLSRLAEPTGDQTTASRQAADALVQRFARHRLQRAVQADSIAMDV